MKQPGLKRQRRCFFDLGDRRAQVLNLSAASRAHVYEHIKCSGVGCYHLSPHWHRNPRPIDLVVVEMSRAWVDKVYDIALLVFDAALVDVLEPYCRHLLVGDVRLSIDGRTSEPTRLVTVTAPMQDRIQSDRGRHCRHEIYDCCGVPVNGVGWASGAIVERSLDDRQVYIDQIGHMLVDQELAESLDLKHRFPKLWQYRVDVVPEALDGEVLPGDPGWDGTFRPAPPPTLPDVALKRGRISYD